MCGALVATKYKGSKRWTLECEQFPTDPSPRPTGVNTVSTLSQRDKKTKTRCNVNKNALFLTVTIDDFSIMSLCLTVTVSSCLHSQLRFIRPRPQCTGENGGAAYTVSSCRNPHVVNKRNRGYRQQRTHHNCGRVDSSVGSVVVLVVSEIPLGWEHKKRHYHGHCQSHEC